MNGYDDDDDPAYIGKKPYKDLSFMNKLCNPDYRPVSVIINAPFRLRDDEGKIISIAIEGHALIGIYQDSDYPELKDTERLKVIKVMTPTKLYNQHKIGFGKLKTWAGRPEWPVKCDACTDGYSATCDNCNGSGFNSNEDEDCPSCDGEGKYEEYFYDDVGNKTKFINKNGAEWSYKYDGNGRLIKETSPVVTVTSVSDSLVVTRDNTSLETHITYDALGNVDRHTAERVDHVRKRREVDDDDVVHAEAGKALDGLDG